MAMKSLCYIAHQIVPSERADSIQVMKMCDAFAKKVENVELITPLSFRSVLGKLRFRKMDILRDLYSVDSTFKIRWVLSPFSGLPYKELKRAGYGLLASLYAFHKRYDAVYTRQMWAAFWSACFNIPVIYESHDFNFDKRQKIFPKFLELATRHKMLGIVTISHYLAKEYARMKIPKDRIWVLHDGVDLERFNPHLSKYEARKAIGLERNEKIACYAGQLYEGSGIDHIIEAAGLLNNVIFLIVGGKSNDIKKYKKNVVISKGLTNIVFTGFVKNALIPLYLFASDVLLMPFTPRVPTLKYMSPLKMFEYMAAGRPIVATDLPVIREVLKDKENAVLVEAENTGDLVRGIRDVLDNAYLSSRITRKVRDDVLKYSWDRRADKILGYFSTKLLPCSRV